MKLAIDPNLTASKIDQPVPYPKAKRFLDFSLSLILIIILLPFILLIYLATKVEGLINKNSRGPFLYGETRISQGQPFNFYKIRIFKPKVIEEALKNKGFIHTKPLEQNKENLTLVGRWLKKFYLDELAQLFNVLKGEMSLVGTRPWNEVDYQKELARGIFRKKIIKAGLTGLVQITKGQHQNFAGQDLGLDDYYIAYCRHHPPQQIILFDLKIIFQTLLKLIAGSGL